MQGRQAAPRCGTHAALFTSTPSPTHCHPSPRPPSSNRAADNRLVLVGSAAPSPAGFSPRVAAATPAGLKAYTEAQQAQQLANARKDRIGCYRCWNLPHASEADKSTLLAQKPV
jgi:hypothetical protein